MSESREFELQAEIASLRKDAERYRWLREVDPLTLYQIAWRTPEGCQDHATCDDAIDASMKSEGQMTISDYVRADIEASMDREQQGWIDDARARLARPKPNG